MKIVRETATSLTVRNVPWIAGGFFYGMGAAALFAALASLGEQHGLAGPLSLVGLSVLVLAGGWWFAPAVTVVFDRGAGRVTFTEHRPLSRRVRDFPLDGATKVVVQSDREEGLTRLALLAEGVETPLERGFGSGDRRRTEARINAWLHDERTGAAPGATVRRRGGS